MTLMIELPPKLEKKLKDRASSQGMDASTFACTILEDVLISDDEELEEALEGIRRGLADAAAGRERPLSEFISEQRAKHGFAPTWPNE